MRERVKRIAEKRGITTKAYYSTIATDKNVAAVMSELRAANVKEGLAAELLNELKED